MLEAGDIWPDADQASARSASHIVLDADNCVSGVDPLQPQAHGCEGFPWLTEGPDRNDRLCSLGVRSVTTATFYNGDNEIREDVLVFSSGGGSLDVYVDAAQECRAQTITDESGKPVDLLLNDRRKPVVMTVGENRLIFIEAARGSRGPGWLLELANTANARAASADWSG